MSGPVVFMAGGGTGGHVFPLVAVAHALRKLCPTIRPIFIGTERGMETRFVPEQGFELELLEVLPIRGRGVMGAFRGVMRAAALLPESRALIRKYKPEAVFSIGGYAAGPVSLAARTMGLPVALMEPNSVIGLANWLIAPFVQRAYTAFTLTEKHFRKNVLLASGVPLRPGFDPRPFRVQDGPMRVLVLGGSQGAKALNEILPQSLCQVTAPLSIVHQCGQAHAEVVEKRYRELLLQAGRAADTVSVVPFITDMPSALANADLVIGRSGAGAVSEITSIGRPSLLIPYPYASGDHQRYNAEALAEGGAARCILESAASVDRMRQEIANLAEQRSQLSEMAQKATALGRPLAAERVARDFLALAGIATSGLSAPPTGGDQSLSQSLGAIA